MTASFGGAKGTEEDNQSIDVSKCQPLCKVIGSLGSLVFSLCLIFAERVEIERECFKV